MATKYTKIFKEDLELRGTKNFLMATKNDFQKNDQKQHWQKRAKDLEIDPIVIGIDLKHEKVYTDEDWIVIRLGRYMDEHGNWQEHRFEERIKKATEIGCRYAKDVITVSQMVDKEWLLMIWQILEELKIPFSHDTSDDSQVNFWQNRQLERDTNAQAADKVKKGTLTLKGTKIL